ncbi:MAG TPA: hypothetical protein VE996_02090 [Terriglobales bacterium]|nr:hypothetical protein [Terriglobales bacterium]
MTPSRPAPFALRALALLAALSCAVAAQQAPSVAPAPSAPPAYRLEYVIREYDGAKLLNQRRYQLLIAAPDHGITRANISVGDRVPVSTGPNQFQYENAGVQLQCDLRGPAVPGAVQVSTTVTLTSLVAPASSASSGSDASSALPGGPSSSNSPSAPVLRNASTHADSLVTPNKPAMLASIDDVSTTHRYEIWLTAVPQP